MEKTIRSIIKLSVFILLPVFVVIQWKKTSPWCSRADCDKAASDYAKSYNLRNACAELQEIAEQFETGYIDDSQLVALLSKKKRCEKDPKISVWGNILNDIEYCHQTGDILCILDDEINAIEDDIKKINAVDFTTLSEMSARHNS